MIVAYIALVCIAFALAMSGLRIIVTYMADSRDGFPCDTKDLILGILLVDNAFLALGIIYILKTMVDK